MQSKTILTLILLLLVAVAGLEAANTVKLQRLGVQMSAAPASVAADDGSGMMMKAAQGGCAMDHATAPPLKADATPSGACPMMKPAAKPTEAAPAAKPATHKPAADKPAAAKPASHEAAAPHAVAPAAPAAEYICTMCPEVKASKPGDCPKCGMALVKKGS